MPTPRSNVMPVSNVVPRDARLGRVGDTAFVRHVRGGPAIRRLVADILGRSTPPPSSAEERDILSVLRPEQYAQRHETLRCRTCQRVVYGPVRLPDGDIHWKWLFGSECRCGSGA